MKISRRVTVKRASSGPAETRTFVTRDLKHTKHIATLRKRFNGKEEIQNRTFVKMIISETPEETQHEFSPLQWQTTVAKKITKVREIWRQSGNIRIVTYKGPKSMKFVIKHPSKDIHRAVRCRTGHKICQVCHQVPEQRLARSDRIMEVSNLCYKTNWSIEDRCLFSNSVLCVRPRNAEPIEAWSMRLEDVWDTSSFYGKYDTTGRSMQFQWHTIPRHIPIQREREAQTSLEQFPRTTCIYIYIYICTCSTTSTARTRTTKSNVSKLQSNFDKANGASVDRVQKNMARRWLARRRLGPHCDKEAAGVRHC